MLWSKKKNMDLEFMQKAFPSIYESDIKKILPLLKHGHLSYHDSITPIVVGDEKINLPSRIYYEEVDSDTLEKLTEKQKRIVFCYFLCHHNGYVRQKYLGKLLESGYLLEHEIPYVVYLMGSYVIEIINDIYESFEMIKLNGLDEFICGNPRFILTIEGRIGSYWGEYYSNVPKKEYCGFKIQKYLKKTRKECRLNNN